MLGKLTLFFNIETGNWDHNFREGLSFEKRSLNYINVYMSGIYVRLEFYSFVVNEVRSTKIKNARFFFLKEKQKNLSR